MKSQYSLRNGFPNNLLGFFPLHITIIITKSNNRPCRLQHTKTTYTVQIQL